MRHPLLVITTSAVGGLLLTTAPAVAGGPPIVNDTEHIVNETLVDIGEDPCTGAAAEVTIVESGVIHFAAFTDGTVHFTGTLRGTFAFDLLPADGIPDTTARFTTWFGGNGLLNEDGTASGRAQAAFTFNARGRNADGSTFNAHQNGNTVFDADGVPKLDVFHERLHCR